MKISDKLDNSGAPVGNVGPGGPAGATGPKATGGAGQASSAGVSGAGAAAGDQVTLSPEIKMLQEATEAMAAAPEIRPDVVARMRELLADGQLGADASKLADAIVDNWLHGL